MFNLPGSTATAMVKYTFAEVAGMRLFYSADYENGTEAALLYGATFPIHR
jgi:hypothetical protein